MKFFAILFLAAGVIITLVLFGAEQGYFEKPTFFYKTLSFLIFSTSLIYIYLSKEKSRGFFLQLYLLTMVVKLLAYFAYNLVMVLNDKPAAFNNVVFFMITYFIFTFLEIGFLYSKITGGTKG